MENNNSRNNKFINKKNHQNNDGVKKKPFDKKKWREQKYNNKFAVNQWEEKRKKAALRHLNKELRKEKCQTIDLKKNSESSDQGETSKHKGNHPKVPFFSAKQEFLRKKQEKQKKIEEFMKAKAEREEALRKYKQKKMETYKKLSMKTKKGQPAMKGRMEILLEKIQKNCQ